MDYQHADYQQEPTFRDLVALLRTVIDAGRGHQILLGNDLGRPSYWRAYGGGPGLDYVLTRFVPRLREEGFGEGTLHALLVDNPRRFFAGEPPAPGPENPTPSA